MLHVVTRVCLAVVLLCSSLLSFLTVRFYEHYAAGLGWSHTVYAKSGAGALDDRTFAARVTQVAADEKVGLAHLAVLGEGTDEDVRVYLSSGVPRWQRWLADGRYPSFDAATEIRAEPLARLGPHPRGGYWFVEGTPQQVRRVVARLADLGLEPEVVEGSRAAYAVQRALDAPLDRFTTLTVFLVACLAAAGVFLRARSLAVLQLHGHTTAGVLGRDLAAGGRWLLLRALPVWAVLAAGVLYAYNRLAWFGIFVSTAAMFAGALLALALVVHLAALVVVDRMDCLERIKGRVRSRVVHTSLHLARLSALALGIGMLGAVVMQHELVQGIVRDRAVWATTAGDTQLGMRTVPPGTERQAYLRLGRALEDEDRAGRMILVDRTPLGETFTGPGGRVPVYGSREWVTVNTTYLKARPVLDLQGRPVRPGSRPEVLLLVPPGTPVPTGELVRATREDIAFEVDLRRRRGEQPIGSAPPVRVVPIRPGQAHFVYTTGVSWNQSPYARDAVLTVLPAGHPFMAPDQLAALTSQGKIILTDKAAALRAVERRGARDVLGTVDQVRAVNARHVREVLMGWNLHRFSLAAVLLAIVLTALGFALVHAQRHADRIFAQIVHGWPFLRRHRLVLGIDLALVAGLTTWLTWRSQTPPGDGLHVAGVPPLWAGPVIALVALGVLWAALSLAGARLVRHRATD